MNDLVYLGDLVQLTEGELLRLPNFGRKSLDETRALLADYGYGLGVDLPGWDREAAVLEKLTAIDPGAAETLLSHRAQQLDTLSEQVEWPARIRHVLRLQGAVNLRDVVALDAGVLLRLPNFGRKSLAQIDAILARRGLSRGMDVSTYPQSTTSKTIAPPTPPTVSEAQRTALSIRVADLNLSARAANTFSTEELYYVGQVAKVTAGKLLRLPNFGRVSLKEVSAALARFDLTLGMDVDNWSPKLADDPGVREKVRLLRQALEDWETPSADLHTSLRARVEAAEQSPRNHDLILRQLGWDGYGPQTLESVAAPFNLTRERVRQIVRRARVTMARRSPPRALVDALALAHELVPCSREDWDRALGQAGLTYRPFHPGGLQTAAEVFELPIVFEVLPDVGLLPFGAEDVPRRFLAAARRHVSARGCADLYELTEDMASEVHPAFGCDRGISFLRGLVDEADDFEWLDRDSGWFWRACGFGRNRLINNVAKVLAASPSITIGELRGAIRREPRMRGYTPPSAILKAACARLPFARLEGDVLVRKEAALAWDQVLGELESILVQEIDRIGPVAQWTELLSACADRGMNAGSFAAMSSRSIVLWRPAGGLLARVGAALPPGLIEAKLRDRPAERGGLTLESGWTSNGLLFLTARPSTTALATGYIYIAVDIRPYVQGNYELQTLDGEALGELQVRGQNCGDLRRLFRRLGAEAGDVAVLWFNPAAKLVVSAVGDRELASAAHLGPPNRAGLGEDPELDE